MSKSSTACLAILVIIGSIAKILSFVISSAVVASYFSHSNFGTLKWWLVYLAVVSSYCFIVKAGSVALGLLGITGEKKK